VTYTLTDLELRIHYDAIADAATHVNLTQHSYFNLRGSGDVLGHCLAINAATYLPVNEQLIPTGEFAPVANSPFDFQESTAIGARLHSDHPQLARGGGYDHNFNLNRGEASPLTLAARVRDPLSHRTLELRTTEPGLQFYCGHLIGRRGLCLETQHLPDSPHHPYFPTAVLRPDERFHSTTIWQF
jgi:aldose 1-epimerase